MKWKKDCSCLNFGKKQKMPTQKKITGYGSKLSVKAMNYGDKDITEKIFDLKDHKGERVRTHITLDNKYTIETRARQKLLLCELDVPKRKFEHTEKIVAGETVVESKEKALKLEELTIKEY